MKKLLAVAVALCCCTSSFALWDYFPVIEGGSVEAKLAYDGGAAAVKVRYGLTDRLELFSANGAANDAEYAIGARYQFAPEIFSAFADLGIPHGSHGDWGITPGAQFSAGSETVAFGAALSLPLHFNHPGSAEKPTSGNPRADGFSLDVAVGGELDIAFSDQVLFGVGVDFCFADMGNSVNGPDGDRDFKINEPGALVPAFGLTFSKDNLSIGTKLGINLAASNDKGDESVSLIGGVDVGIKF
jgi:opacity protein-like surface antigen